MSGRFWPVLAGFSNVSTTNSSCSEATLLERKKVMCQGLCRLNPTAANHPSAPRVGMCGHSSGCRTNRRVWDRPDLTVVLILWRGGGFVSKKSQLTWLGSFRPTRLPQTLDRPRPVVAGAPRPHRVAGRLARSARQKSRDGVTGGMVCHGSDIVGSRDLMRIVARSRDSVTWCLRLNSNRGSHGDRMGLERSPARLCRCRAVEAATSL
jgi:hypothetical protein